MTNTDTITIHCAMWNLPGCLPEVEPFRTLDEESAREFLADAVDEASGSIQPGRDSICAVVRAEKAAEGFRSEGLDLAHVGGYVYTITSGPPIDDEEARRAALATHLGCELGEVEGGRFVENQFDADGAEFLVLTDSEADEAAAVYLRDSVWAFNAAFLSNYTPDGIGEVEITALRGDKCEDINDAFTALVEAGHGMKELIDDAISCDGRAHFLNTYDGEEAEEGGFLIYRTN